MNRIIAIVLMLSLSCQSLVRLGIVAWYEVNKDYITEKFCINKDKPQMKCCGKCYLRKQLKKVENTNNSEKQQQRKTNKTESFDCILTSLLQFPFVGMIATHQYGSFRIRQHHFLFVASVFHPPPARV